MKKTKGERIYSVFCYAVCTIVGLLCLYPLVYCLFVSLTTKREVAQNGGFVTWFPRQPTLLAYKKVLSNTSFVGRALQITMARTVLGSLLGLAVNSLAGYALSRKDLPGRKLFLSLMLVPILFGGGLIPTYLVIQSLGLIDTFWVLVLPTLFSAFNVLIFKQFFEGIPPSLEEAALVDGVSELKLFTRIILPMSKPVMASIGLFTVVGQWNSWFDGFLYIGQTHADLWPLQTYIMQMFNNMNNMNNPEIVQMMISLKQASSTGADVPELATRMALTLVTLAPILIIYPFFQKYFTSGVYMGAVKE
ncbi:MAG: carbohydrate ABC transporter permease [Acutalibacter sp.]|nr:carbohydrate ABC transporter permease [Acutalibacter sp.]